MLPKPLEKGGFGGIPFLLYKIEAMPNLKVFIKLWFVLGDLVPI